MSTRFKIKIECDGKTVYFCDTFIETQKEGVLIILKGLTELLKK